MCLLDYTQQIIQMKFLKLTHYHMQTCILMELEQEGVVDIYLFSTEHSCVFHKCINIYGKKKNVLQLKGELG